MFIALTGGRALCCWLSVVLLLSGCPESRVDNTPHVPAAVHAGAEIRILVPTGLDLVETWTPALNDWADESGGSAEIIELDFASTDELTLAEKLEAERAMLVVLPAPLVNSLVAEDLIAPIPQQVLDQSLIAWNDIPPPVRQTLGSLRGVPSMVPVTCPIPICCYRADLLESAGKQIPATWEEYDVLAATVSQWAPGLSAVEPWAPQHRVTTFLSRAVSAAKHPAQYSAEWNVMTGMPLIDSAPYLQTLTETVAIKPHLADAVESYSPDDCLRELREGRAAMGIVWEVTSLGSTGTNDQSAARVRDSSPLPERVSLSFAPLPGRKEVYDRETGQWGPPPVQDRNRPALCGRGGFSVCVLSTATEQEQSAAWDLWGLLESYQLDGTIQPLPGTSLVAPRPGTSSAGEGLSAVQWQQSREAITASLQNPLLVCELPVYGQQRFRSALSEALGQAWKGEQTPAEALSAVAAAWSSVMESLGERNVLNSYRRRLGLSPLPE